MYGICHIHVDVFCYRSIKWAYRIKFLNHLQCRKVLSGVLSLFLLKYHPLTWNWYVLLVHSHDYTHNLSRFAAFLQCNRLSSEMQVLEGKLENSRDEISAMRMSLDEARSNSDRLHRESELVVTNVNKWVQEQKWVVKLIVFWSIVLNSVFNGSSVTLCRVSFHLDCLCFKHSEIKD